MRSDPVLVMLESDRRQRRTGGVRWMWNAVRWLGAGSDDGTLPSWGDHGVRGGNRGIPWPRPGRGEETQETHKEEGPGAQRRPPHRDRLRSLLRSRRHHRRHPVAVMGSRTGMRLTST